MDKNNTNEEVTITPVIRDIEKLINKLLSMLLFILKAIGKGLKNFFKFIILKIKLLTILFVVGFSVGLASFWISPTEYASSLVLQLNIDARAQLFSDVVYFNSLVQREQNEKLMELFSISEKEAKSILEFEIKPFSTFTERIEYVDRVYRRLDTSYQKLINLEEIVDETDFSYSNKFLIVVTSTDEFIFQKLEAPLLAFLERVPELNTMRKKELDIFELQKKTLIKEIQDLDTLKKISNNVLIEQAKSKNRSNSGTSISLGQSSEANIVNPLEIFSKVAEYNKEIISIEKQLDNFSNCYKVFSHMNPVGFKNSLGRLARSALFGFVFFGLGIAFLALSSAKKQNR